MSVAVGSPSQSSVMALVYTEVVRGRCIGAMLTSISGSGLVSRGPQCVLHFGPGQGVQPRGQILFLCISPIGATSGITRFVGFVSVFGLGVISGGSFLGPNSDQNKNDHGDDN